MRSLVHRLLLDCDSFAGENLVAERLVVRYMELQDVVGGETELILTHRGLPTAKSANDH